MTESKSPGFRKKPDYPLTVAPAEATIHIRFGGETIAKSNRALVMNENDYGPVYYVPRADVQMERLSRTAHSTFCPFKGTASYWTISVGEKTADDAVWSYEDPYEEVAEIRETMSFYASKVDAINVEAN